MFSGKLCLLRSVARPAPAAERAFRDSRASPGVAPHRPVTFRVVNLGDHEVADDKACAARNDLSRKAGVERAPIARFQRLVPAEALTLLPSLEETLSPPPGKSPRPPFPATRPIDWLRLTQ